MNWAKVYELFDELPKTEQFQLFQAMQTTLFPEPKEDIATLVSDIREADSAVVLPASIAEASLLSETESTALVNDTFVKTVERRLMI